MPRPSKYTPEVRDQCLLVLAMHGGACTQASETLAGQGIKIEPGLLSDWKTRTHSERYHELLTTHAPQLEQIIVARTKQHVIRALDVEDALLERIAEQIPIMRSGDLGGTLRNVATAAGIKLDKALVLENRPTHITEHRNADELMRSIANMANIVEGTATEIPTPTLQESNQ